MLVSRLLGNSILKNCCLNKSINNNDLGGGFYNLILKSNSITQYNYTSLLCTSLSQHQQQYNLSSYNNSYNSYNKRSTQSTKTKERLNNKTLTKHKYRDVQDDHDDNSHYFKEREQNGDSSSNSSISNTNSNTRSNPPNIDISFDTDQVERLQKRLSRSGVTSRRQAEKMIMEGRVRVNGKVASMKSDLFVKPTDIVTVDNKMIQESLPRIWLHNKQCKVLVSNVQDPEKPTLIPILKSLLNKDHLMSVGRLDYYSEGLILITNDGELSRYLELPQSGFEKTYRVRLFGKITPEMKTALTRGVTIDGIKYAPMQLSIQRETDSNTWVICTLTEGKNREIRRIFEHFNVKVLRIIRTKFGPYSLPDSLKPGETIEVQLKDEIKLFRNKWAKKEKLIRKAKEQILKANKNNNNNNNKMNNQDDIVDEEYGEEDYDDGDNDYNEEELIGEKRIN